MLLIYCILAVVFDQKFHFNKDGRKNLNSYSELHDQEMINLAREVFVETGLKLTEGPYCYYALPNYESPADIQIMHDLGAASVGASTLPE